MNYIKVINDINKHKFKYGFFELIALLIKDGISYFLIIKAYYY